MTDGAALQVVIGILNVIVLALFAWGLRNLHMTLVRLAVLETQLGSSLDTVKALTKAFSKHVDDPAIHHTRFQVVDEGMGEIKARVQALEKFHP